MDYHQPSTEIDVSIRAAWAALPFSLLEEAQVPCRYERSAKFLPGKLLANRYLLDVEYSSLLQSQWEAVCHALKMPTIRQAEFLKSLESANQVLIGFEDEEESCSYKLYTEFYDQRVSELHDELHPPHWTPKPVVMYHGYKWNPVVDDDGCLTTYWWYPMLKPEALLARLRGFCDKQRQARPAEFSHWAATLALQQTDQIIYLEARGDDGLRHSFDLNIYDANFKVADFSQGLRRLAEQYAIPVDQFDQLITLVGDNPLGHISSGVDRRGRDFLTIYYEYSSTSTIA